MRVVPRQPARPRATRRAACEHDGQGTSGCSRWSTADRLRRVLRVHARRDGVPLAVRHPRRSRAITREHPYVFRVDGERHRVDYEPAESTSGLFGGNSNWRGPIWFPVNYLLIESLADVPPLSTATTSRSSARPARARCMTPVARSPTNSRAGSLRHLPAGRRRAAARCYGGERAIPDDPHWRGLVLFHEYFHGTVQRYECNRPHTHDAGGSVRHDAAEQTAVIAPEQNIRITYGALRKRDARLCAEALAAAGVNRGDRVGIALAQWPAEHRHVSGRVAGWHRRAGSTRDTKRTSSAFISRTPTPKSCSSPPDGLDEARARRGQRADLRRWTWMPGRHGRSLRDVTGRKPVASPDSDDIALVLHTSGSTGRPKRVPFLHANLSVSAGIVADSTGSRQRRVVVRNAVASTSTAWWRRPYRRSPRRHRGGPDEFIRFRSGGSRATTTRRGHRRCQRFIICCSRGWKRARREPAGAERLRFIRSCSASLPAAGDGAKSRRAFGVPVLRPTA